MIEWYREQQRNRRLKTWMEWRDTVTDRILGSVFPPATPYIFDAGFSFLQQSDRLYPDEVTRLDLLFPDFPLAVDLLDPRYRTPFRDAESFAHRWDWTVLQSQLAIKAQQLEKYRVPYLQIRDDDPVDEASLTDRIRALIGRPPR
jgi:hypothetical protein